MSDAPCHWHASHIFCHTKVAFIAPREESRLRFDMACAIRSELAHVGILSADIRAIAPSLEDVFVALTTRGEKLGGEKLKG